MRAAVRDLTRLELTTEAIRAALEELARDAPHLLQDAVDEQWAKRYGRPVRLVSQPSRPVGRLKEAGADAYELLRLLQDRPRGRQADAPRQIFGQHFVIDRRGLARPRTEADGFPPGRLRIVSPYDLQARYGCRGDKRWTGYLIHTTETCDEGTVNLVTDVATTCATRHDSQALPGIQDRLQQRRLLPSEHLVDSGYTSAALMRQAARHNITLIGPLRGNHSWQQRARSGFSRDAFTIDYDRRQVTCLNGQTSAEWIQAPPKPPT